MMYLGSNAVGIAEAVFPAGMRTVTETLDTAATSIVFHNVEVQPYVYMYAYDGDSDAVSGKYMMLRGCAIKNSDNSYQGRQYCNRGGTTYAVYDCTGSYDSVEKTFTINSGVNFRPETYRFWYISNTLS